ncbi:MAG: DedA family protein [Actinomycetales bacterium]|nr:DedA family protein [Actinomycetales bacterium]
MTELISTLSTLLLDAAAEPWLPLALLLFCTVDGFFPPVPSESLVIGLAALAAATGTPNIWLVLIAGAAGAVLGDLTAYGLGRRVGTRGFAWMRTPRMVRAVDRAGRTLRRRGALFLITGRFVPVVRVVINVTAGATGMPLRRYLPLCLAAGTAWASFGATIGWLGGTWMHDHPLLGVALAIGLGVVLGGLVDRLVQRFALEPEQEEPYAEVPAESDRSPDMIGR